VVQGDALSMPFSDETFSSAMVAFGIRNIENLDVFLNEMHRIMKPRGRFSILEFSMPESIPFRLLYTMYLTYVLPVIGGLISGDFEAYRYLRDSVMRFPPPMVLARIMEERNFRIVQSTSLCGGISHLYLVEKQ
jgi:demethylmenaquinone methyltransferase/2-methoxy-6-polyprenyl-1,4-benzoquinol methylase